MKLMIKCNVKNYSYIYILMKLTIELIIRIMIYITCDEEDK